MNRQLFISDCIFTANPKKPLISGAILVQDGIIEDVIEGFPDNELLRKVDKIHDLRAQLLCPGLVDAHTHLVHGGSRENELLMKLNGKSYMDIHAAGGGIFSTVRASRQASETELYEKAKATLQLMLEHGSTTVESKSGYCLDLEGELKLLRVNQRLQAEQAVDLAITYMGAHATPQDYPGGHEAYIEDMMTEIMPRVKAENLAEFVDIFCEEGIFSLAETEALGQRAKELGFKLKIHADEIVSLGGAGLAADLKAVSAEHLMQIKDSDIEKLKASGTVAVLLPATSFFLMSPQYAPARKMLDSGVTVALATDYNPGSCPCPNLQMVMSFAAYQLKMTPLEILFAVTINAAKAIDRADRIGSIEPGKECDLVAFKVKSPEELIYSFGRNLVSDVWKAGRHLVHQ
ncbi:MAG: imidazolonepropionase [Eubacteriales bacterium]|nr:imidazolonepropionase [Eubacteriales bacterium]